MEEKDVRLFAETVQELIRTEHQKLEDNLEKKLHIDIEKHKKQHELFDKYDEIFNEEVMEFLRVMIQEEMRKKEERDKRNDWIMKTIVGSVTIGALGFFYAVGKIVLANLGKIAL